MRADSFRQGLRVGAPYGAVGFVLSLSFGVLAVQAGFTPLQAVATAGLVFAGSAQFTALSIVSGGGTAAAAVGAATLMHEVCLLILALTAMSAVMKGVGPTLFGGRELPRWSVGVGVAALLLWRRVPLLVAALAAVLVTAGLRALLSG